MNCKTSFVHTFDKVSAWRQTVEEMWDDLLELMETRRQLLTTALRRHKFFAEADELLARFDEKEKSVSNAKDATGVAHELTALQPQVKLLTLLLADGLC